MEHQYDYASAHNTPLPEITQYGIKLPFRVAIVGQTDSGKTHSIMHSWLGGNQTSMELPSMPFYNIAYFAAMVACPMPKRKIW